MSRLKLTSAQANSPTGLFRLIFHTVRSVFFDEWVVQWFHIVMIIYSWLLIVCCDWLLQQQQRSGRQKAMRHSGLFWQVSCSEAHSLRPLVDLYQVSSHYSHRVIILSSTCVCLSLSSSLSLGRRPRIPLSDVCAYNAGDTRSRNIYQKLSLWRSIWYQFFSGTSFLHAIEHSSIPEQKLSGTWHEPCNVIGRTVVLVQESEETVTNLR